MGTFSLSGGVEVVGFISPTDPQDTYPVIDPLYGIDGFRNVNNLIDLNNIPEERRRAGMVVGVSGGTSYYKLNVSPWSYTISDWSVFNSAQGITGGTSLGSAQEVFKQTSGNTMFFRTISGGTNVTATTVGDVIKLDVTIPIDTNTYVTGGTISYVGSNGTITLKRNDNVDVTLTGLTDLYVTGGSYSNGVISLINNEGTSFSVSGFSTALSGDYLPLSGGTVTGATIFQNGITVNTISATTYQNLPTDIRVTGGTYVGNTITFTNNTGGTFTVTGITTSSAFTGGTVTGATNFTGGLTANTISATTYQNLPTDIRVTGGTYSNGTAIFTNNTGGTFNVAGFYTGGTDVFVTGGTYSTGTATFRNNTGGTFNVTGFTDTYVTGATFSGTSLIIYRNENQPNINANISTVSLSGALSSVTFNIATSGSLSATTYLGLPTDIRVTGGTYSAGTITFTNNTGGTFNVTGLTTGSTSTTIGGNYLPLSGGTVTGGTIFNNGLTANTISATTYQNLPLGIYGTGLTFNTSNYDLTLDGSNGILDTISLSILASDLTVTGGTYNSNTGTATFTNNTGGTFNVTGFLTGFTDTFVSGASYNNNTFTFTNTTGGSFNVSFNSVTGLTSTGTISSDTISATTYVNLPSDIRVTGATYSNNTFVYTNNTGGTFNVLFNTLTGLTINGNITVTGTSNLNGDIISTNLSGSTDRLVQVSSGGTFSASQEIIQTYISSLGAVATLLDTTTNWDINGVYIGSTITGTYQGQKHYNSDYFFEAVDDNLWIRLIRG